MTHLPLIAVVEPFNWNALVQTCSAFISLCALIVGTWVAYRVEQRAQTAKTEGEILKKVATDVGEVKTTVGEVQVAANGLHHALVKAEKSASQAEGQQKERVEERQRVDDKAEKVAAAEKAPAVAAEPLEVKVISTPTEPVHTTPVKKP